MSVQNVLPVPTLTELSLDEHLLPVAPKSQLANDSDGSIGSHLLFGLGTLIFASPMLIPGIPLSWLAVTYVGLMAVVVVGFTVWSVFSSLKARMLPR